MTTNREYTPARKAQGFRSQAHLDAFYVYYDHTQTCPDCRRPGKSVWLEGDASWQSTATVCPVGQALSKEF